MNNKRKNKKKEDSKQKNKNKNKMVAIKIMTLMMLMMTSSPLVMGRCITGNLAEFVLSPVFSGRDTIFACHVHPVPRYTIYDIEFSVLYQGLPVNGRRLKARRVHEQTHQPKAVDVSVF